MLRHLDRLCRTLHTLNYFAEVDEGHCLYLNIEHRLLASVPNEHGKVFEGILAKFNLSTKRIVIVFPRTAVTDPGLLGRAARNYRACGYRVMVPISSWDESALRLFAEAPVDLVKVDVVPGFASERLAALALALGESGVLVLAGKVESADLLKKVIDANVDLAQGFLLGAPAALPGRQPPQTPRVVANASPRPGRGSLGRAQRDDRPSDGVLRAGARSPTHAVLIVPCLGNSGPGQWQTL